MNIIRIVLICLLFSSQVYAAEVQEDDNNIDDVSDEYYDPDGYIRENVEERRDLRSDRIHDEEYDRGFETIPEERRDYRQDRRDYRRQYR
jgi:hypothetical protein